WWRIAPLLQAAMRHHQAGALAEAEPLYRAILRREPRQADAQNLLGLLHYQRGEHPAAVAALRRAVMLRPGAPEYHRNLGMALRAQGLLPEALAACRRAVALQPDSPESQFNLGNILAEQGEAAGAAAAFRAAVARQPGFAAARLNLAHALLLLKRAPEAEAALRPLLAAAPGHPQALYNLGLSLMPQERWAEAEAAFRAARDAGAEAAGLAANLAITLQEQERWPEAEAAWRALLASDPAQPEAWFGLGLALQCGAAAENAARRDAAAEAFDRACALRPDYCDAWYNLAHLRRQQGALDAARAALDRALALQPEDASALTNLANLLALQGWPEQALPLARRAAALLPDDPLPRTNLARLLLLQGHYAEGWDAYEGRVREEADAHYDFGLPAWDGAALPGDGRVLVWREQGIGDEVMFCALLPELLAAGHRLTLICDRRFEPALLRAMPELRFLHRAPPPPEIRAQISMASLPRLFRRREADFSANHAYLAADPARRDGLRARYDSGPGDRLVGLSWHTAHPRSGYRRNIPLTDFAPLFACPGLRWVSLQYGDPDALAAEAKAAGLDLRIDAAVDPRADLEAALAQVAAMDHVVSIDNSVAHFAGSLGVSCDLLLPLAPDWRWQTARADTPWYPSLRLHRRGHGEDWPALLRRVAAQLPQGLPSAVARNG
ncbi:tetratricopeptide repeat protein, partial [Roseomonas sp. 18066]|uniref:tetratricopeptide repeat-containing glycosyltransferase family protein n=1 Tax=Roseomonas sp. 18066 TaxID=2681412 RepID=UPI00135A27FF